MAHLRLDGLLEGSRSRFVLLQTTNQFLEKMKEGEHVFDVHAELEPEPEDDDAPDFDADYEEGEGEERSKEHKEGCESSGSGHAR